MDRGERMRARRVIVCLVLSMLVTSGASVYADVNGPGYTPPPSPIGTGTIADNTPVAIAIDGPDGTIATYRSPRGRSGKGPSWTCRYYETSASLGTTAISVGPDKTKPLPTVEVGEFYWLECVDDQNEVTYATLVMWDPANPLATIAAGSRAAEQALQALPLPDPVIHSNPPENTSLLVGLDSWFRIDSPWQPQTVSASIAAISASVTATPTSVTWNFGDGSDATTCDGPGRAFSTDNNESEHAACTHTYINRSTKTDPNGTYTVTATVTYEVTWTATDNTSGTLEPVTRTGTINLRVQEAQAVLE